MELSEAEANERSTIPQTPLHRKYIVDFCAVKEKLVIELDGSQHLDPEENDNERTEFLNSKGFRVIRFWNNDVMNNIQAVLQEIEKEIQAK